VNPSSHQHWYGGATFTDGQFTGIDLPYLDEVVSDPNATKAIRSVGTNALPMLIPMLSAKDSRPRVWMRRHTAAYSFIDHWLPSWRVRMGLRRQTIAVAAFRELGQVAVPAIPRITPLLADPECAPAAIMALLAIHPEREQDILALTNVLRSNATYTK